MKNLEEIKKNLNKGVEHMDAGHLDQGAWQSLIVRRVKKQRGIGMQYFWASFIYQVIVYGFLAHVIIKYWEDQSVLLPSFFCLVLNMPFTVVLVQKFKRLAIVKFDEKLTSDLSIKECVIQQYRLLTSFYKFKTRYEAMLVPLSSAAFVWIFFRLYFPDGVTEYPKASILLFILVLSACSAAILAENKRNFKTPITRLEEILKDINAK